MQMKSMLKGPVFKELEIPRHRDTLDITIASSAYAAVDRNNCQCPFAMKEINLTPLRHYSMCNTDAHGTHFALVLSHTVYFLYNLYFCNFPNGRNGQLPILSHATEALRLVDKPDVTLIHIFV